MRSYVFQIDLIEEDDGRWSAVVPALPGCAAWGHTKDEALKAIQDATEAYIEDMIEAGDALPTEGVLTVDAPVVTVTHDG
ncbi:MAG: type II toxin-antitoxin system HicB family antitoxin [Candidatus Tectomicrobia bacterium]|nr:type II toxin-antitoxin system HicB family antitoxin [Candidatus Tectomicrobia bacterium]